MTDTVRDYVDLRVPERRWHYFAGQWLHMANHYINTQLCDSQAGYRT